MAYIHRGLFVVLSLVIATSSQQDDPVKDFCRRWGHTTAQIDSRLYIDGGMIASEPFTSNHTNPWLLFSDLNSSTVDTGMPSQHANLSKPGNIPSVSGGYLWADDTNKCFYQFGGEYPEGVSPTDVFSMWTYDVPLNQWNATDTKGDKSLQRVSFGAGTQVESRGLGFYLGGWLSNRSTLGWTGPPMATNGLIQFDMSTGELKNRSGPDDTGRAEGHLLFLPVSDSGILIYFGGIEDTYRNGSFDAANMSEIHIYDMASSKWYTQTATGEVPLARRQFCADVTWPDDQSSFNIYLYGGYGFGEAQAFDDVYILSLPSFTWIKAFPLDGSDSSPSLVGHGGCSANAINHTQMLVIGGWFPLYDKCDAPEGQGQHNMVLGYNGREKKLWDKYDPGLDTYVVPSPIIAAIGGGPTGGATKTSPSTWDHPDLGTYATIRPSFVVRSATRSIPSATATSAVQGSGKTHVAAIAGGVVGGAVILICILGLILYRIHRRKKALKKSEAQSDPTPPPPAELGATVPQEMAASDASKYVQIHEQGNPIALFNYPGHAQHHSQTPSHDYNYPYSTQGPPSYGHAPPYGSPTDGGHSQPSPHFQGNADSFVPSNSTGQHSPSTSWDQQAHYPQSATTAQGQYSYPTPTLPRQSPNDAIQQVPIYYPPPIDPASRSQHSRPSFSDHRGSPTGTQYSGEGQRNHLRNMSATSTPAHFYAQPAPHGSPGMGDGEGYTHEDRKPT
ncbi:hypothetical protein BDW02DRAFT_585319 [Decorospora gaudefroyi]|uniref:Cell wall anchored protein n=1 Tax=Decorospora gaudefroyi TaxID=184978 RepID=A0A6A5KSQ9_9PLEO|nr:hypothetical protein BDW02DRAFT_585319 [Decorospora gaudefroyi]